MYALVEINGKQYKAEKGSVLLVDLIEGKDEGESITFDSVLMICDGEEFKTGSPYVGGASLKATVQGLVKGEKILVYKYMRRKSYHKRQGHRQKFTKILVDEIG